MINESLSKAIQSIIDTLNSGKLNDYAFGRYESMLTGIEMALNSTAISQGMYYSYIISESRYKFVVDSYNQFSGQKTRTIIVE